MLIRFPGDETGRLRKLSRPWHGPYCVTSHNETNLTAVKVYFPRESPIQVHQVRVKLCPRGFPAGFYWYGAKQQGPGRPPRWVLANSESQTQYQTGEDTSVGTAGPEQSQTTGTNDPDTLPAGIVDSSLDVVQQDSQDQCDGPAMTQSDYPRDQSERSDLPTVASTCQPTKNEVADAEKTRYPRRPRRRPPDRWM